MPRQTPHDRFLAVVQPMARTDTEQTARLHVAHLPDGFFPQLGETYLRRWHQTFIDVPSAVALVIKDRDGRVAAFLLGTTDQHAYVRDVLERDRYALAWRGVAGMLSHPAVARRFLRTRAELYARKLWSGGRQTSGSSGDAGPGTPAGDTALAPVGVVHAIVTRPPCRGKGYGRLLLRRYESELSGAGTPHAVLVTGATNAAADFYRRLDWRETGRHVDRDGREIIHFERIVGPA
ncbi:hypothetical protein Sya03_57750 [Spirilliplanes yamanashiensis]|uniref:N-acetyltransferase domain-containing protein n=2 Tax=Spirilliplanes yamanashiensis TaxID=42233 RepID=A0A8J3YD69_9ACTN|nr:hypothetical protein Sya03_57750 [Spirilliplanes yamanashiensis]